ncbi:MAG TPA: glycosyltransferase family 4 protein [Kiritimatiellia bacterium]
MEPDRKPRILTNMAFWQSPAWVAEVDSIYQLAGRTSDPDFLPPFREALALWKGRAGSDIVLTMGARESLAYALICMATFRRSNQVMTEVFIDAPKSNNLAWRVKRALYRAAARRSIGILTNSTTELETISRRFRVPKEKLRYVPLNSNIAATQASTRDDGFVLAAGRTLRDYDTLARAAREIGRPIVVIGGPDDLARADLPSNMKVLREVPRDEYLDHLKRCSLVVLPLLGTERATGQVVLLEAMALGKPVVATRAPGTIDYLDHERDGLLVEPGDAEALARAVNSLLGDPARARELAVHALEKTKHHFSMERHTQLKLQAIADLWRHAQ